MTRDESQSNAGEAKDEQVRNSLKQAFDLAARSRNSENSENYEFLEEEVDRLETLAREAFKSRLDVESLLGKLTHKQPLNSAEMKTLELLIVGDAEYYLKYESEVDEWKAQLKRVLDQIASLQTSALDAESLMHIRALCREAHEVVADLVFYFDAKERVAKFQSATQGPLDAEGYDFLTEIVREMLASDRM